VHPGFVETDLTAELMEDPALLETMSITPMAPEVSTRLVLEQIDSSTREAGFINESGQVLPW
jgi:hypothetical protein